MWGGVAACRTDLSDWGRAHSPDAFDLVRWSPASESPPPPQAPLHAEPLALPADSALPIIMIAAGTGISPFIGFLEERCVPL